MNDDDDVRRIANYPDEEMESVWLKITGIGNDPKDIEHHKQIAREHHVDWLIHLRELSEEILLYTHLGMIRVKK